MPKGKRGWRTPICCICNEFPHAKNKRMCAQCHASYMREWRKTHPLTEEQKIFSAVRSHSRMLECRGKFIHKPCQFCGDIKSERHHPEPFNPRKIIYLCRSHHLLHHQGIIDISHLIPQIV